MGVKWTLRWSVFIGKRFIKRVINTIDGQTAASVQVHAADWDLLPEEAGEVLCPV